MKEPVGPREKLSRILALFADKDAFVRRFVLAEALGPPLARRIGTPWTRTRSSSSSSSSSGS